MSKLITLSEAAALLERRRGKKVYRNTIKSWGEACHFGLVNSNGWKVIKAEFLAWASRAGRLKHAEPTTSPPDNTAANTPSPPRLPFIGTVLKRIQNPVKIPIPKLHSSGQAYVRWEGKCKYFGKYGTEKAEKGYWQWREQLLGNKAPSESPLVIDLIKRYTEHHSSKNNKDKLKSISDLGPLSGLHCNEFGPLAFRKFREIVASNGKRCARHVNDLMRGLQRAFRWGVSMELVPLDIYQRMKTVAPLKAHEVKHQAKKRQPAKREDVERTLEELHPIPAAIVQLILFTGARPGEICGMMASEVTKDGPNGTWVFRPGKHKTLHHGKRRFIVFGPKGQAILRQFWPSMGEYFFPSAIVIGHYQVASLKQAVEAAALRAGVPHWTPYQIRHLRLTELTTDKGLEMAATVAGHGETGTTKHYQHEPDVIALNEAV